MEKKSYYAIIPAIVRYNNKLEMGARLMYGEITALCNEQGFCWASNKYFADSYEVSPRNIRRWIKSLQEGKFIRVEINKKKRKIFMEGDYDYNAVDDDGNEKVEKKKKDALPKTKKNIVARDLQRIFRDMAKKFLKIDVMVDHIGYIMVLRAMDKGKLSPDQIKALFLNWFMTQGDDRVTSITACLSARNIEKYKLQHGIISK